MDTYKLSVETVAAETQMPMVKASGFGTIILETLSMKWGRKNESKLVRLVF